MIDAEVVRLRSLRNTALRTRALARVLDAEGEQQSIYAKAMLSCWTIARIATGNLRAHPFLSYQQDPSQMRAFIDRLLASLVGFNAQRQQQSRQAIAKELQLVARELDDARALTRLPDLSDALGRMQLHMRRLLQELGADTRASVVKDAVTAPAMAVENNWPYLAI